MSAYPVRMRSDARALLIARARRAHMEPPPGPRYLVRRTAGTVSTVFVLLVMALVGLGLVYAGLDWLIHI